ncbi:MAG TPA: hypothetical protein VK066_04525 [Chloroflexota bacterium]|nr:hypothetical protein [Chloroflexota bacterium]
MTDLVAWAISALVAVLLATFIWSLASLRALPTHGRPYTRTYDRLGHFLTMSENPDYHENPGEDSAAGPDVVLDVGPRAEQPKAP